MQIFEISSKKLQSGKRPFKAILYKIHPDSCVVDNTGTEYNDNGCTWIEKYCQSNLDSIKGMSVTVEFIDDERIEILGHGDTGIEDGIPVYKNATMIGHFEKGYITDMEIDGEMCRVCCGDGFFDNMRYKPFIDSLEEKLKNDEKIFGSIEIMGKPENDNKIVYLDGWKEYGRIPVEFDNSGWAILSIKPSDNKSKLVELNNQQKEQEDKNMEEIKAMLNSFFDKYADLNNSKTQVEEKIVEVNELTGTVEQLKAALDAAEKERIEWHKKYEELWIETETLQKALAEAQAKERIGELNSALSVFTDEEKAYAKEEIEAFNANPITVEINSITNKIDAEIGRKSREAKAEALKIAEQNSTKILDTKTEDIFGDIVENNSTEDISIF